jgi:hypothetical protein
MGVLGTIHTQTPYKIRGENECAVEIYTQTPIKSEGICVCW